VYFTLILVSRQSCLAGASDPAGEKKTDIIEQGIPVLP
jgi:hypothetical protein